MNTIKVYLDSSGRIATLKKDFPLYQGQFQNVLLNIYVPTAILSSDYEIQHYIGKTTFESAPTKEELDAYVLQQTSKTASEGDTIYVTIGNNFYLYVFNGTAYDATEVSKFPPVTTGITTINVGTIAVQRNGALYKSKTYPTRYIKTFQFEGIDYALYERKLPKTFVALDGFGDNAPKMIINVVNIDKANNGLESLITSQTCRLEVLPSTILDRDEIIEPSVLDEINATLNNLSDKKQDKQIDNATTDNKTVLGAINELDANGKANATNIQSANEAINKVSEDLEKLSQYVGTGEFFVGTMESETIPTGEQVSAFVQETLSRPAKNNDVVIVVVDTASTHPMTYKYRFNGTEWGHYLIPTVEPATNEEWGSIRGSFGDTTGSTQVNVVGGVIKQVLTKKKNGAYEDVAQSIYGQELMTERIVNGETIVGKSAYAFSDGEGNPITETYLNKYVGATKEYVHDFALPNTFNDVHYLNFINGEDRYLNTLGEETKVVKVTGIGEKVLLNARYELNEKFQLSGNNNYNTTFFLQADIPENAYFKLKTYAHKLGEEKKLVAQQILPPQDVTGIVQLSFNSNLNVIPYDVIKLRESDRIIQELTIVRSVSNEANISIFSNSTLASTFYLTTVGKTVVHESAEKGEIDVIRTELPVLDRDSYVADFSLPDTISLHEFAEYMFEIPFTNPLEERTLIYLRDVATDTTYAIQTPYDVGTATTKLLEQTKSADNVYRFVAVLKNGKFVVEQSNLSFVKVDVSDKVDKVGQQEQVYATDGLGNQTSLPYNVTPYGGGIAQRTGDGRLKATNGTENNDLATIEQLSEKQPNIGLYVQGKVYPRNAVVSYSGELYRSLRDENPDEITAPSWQKITSVGESGLRPLGSVAYENLPKVPNIYWFKAMWNISNDFVTDDRFLEGAGKKHKAGTNVACVEDTTNVYKYDVIGSFIDLTDYFTKGEVTALTEANADLIASTQADVSVNSGNIQTINDHIDAGGFLQTTQQTLTPEQKAQALKNANIVLSEKTTEHAEEIGHDSATGKLYSKTPIASADKVGGVKVGENLEITADGTLNAKGGGSATLPLVLDENKTYIVYNITELTGEFPVGNVVKIQVLDNAEIDWGDGTKETIPTAKLAEHTYAKVGAYVISLTNIGEFIFQNDLRIYEMHASKLVAKVIDNAFENCKNFHTFKFQNMTDAKTIGVLAFSYTKMTRLEMASKYTTGATMWQYVFRGTPIKKVLASSQLTCINTTFDGHSGLTEIGAESIEVKPSRGGDVYGAIKQCAVDNLPPIVCSYGVIRGVVQSCGALSSITIDANKLGEGFIERCNNLKTITITGQNGGNWDNRVFKDLPLLDTVKIMFPSYVYNVTSVGSSIFYNCPNIRLLQVPANQGKLWREKTNLTQYADLIWGLDELIKGQKTP